MFVKGIEWDMDAVPGIIKKPLEKDIREWY